MSVIDDRAAEIRQLATSLGVKVTARDGLVETYAKFTPGDAAAYVNAENACNRVLSKFRMIRPGSVWGTDSGSVGGHAGLTGGYCRLLKSGVEKRLAAKFA